MHDRRRGCAQTQRRICSMIVRIVEHTHADHLHAIFFRHVISWLMNLRISGTITLYKHVNASRERLNSLNKQNGVVKRRL